MQANVNKEEILILYNSVEFFFEELNQRGYSIAKVYKKETFFLRILRKILSKLSISKHYLYANWAKNMITYKYVIIFAPVEIEVIKYIKCKNPNIIIKYWYWNPAYRIGRPTLEYYELTELWTFDKNDAKNYQMKYGNTFYFDSISLQKKKEEYDTIFVGKNKHRQEKLNELSTKFQELGLKSYFYIVPNRNEKNPQKIKELSYGDYLNLVSNSRTILDIMPPAQVGLTLRPMESLFLSKKIITDNCEIKKEPFYNENNIFILEDNITSLSQFLLKPYVEISFEIKKKYEFNEWIYRIINNIEFEY